MRAFGWVRMGFLVIALTVGLGGCGDDDGDGDNGGGGGGGDAAAADVVGDAAVEDVQAIEDVQAVEDAQAAEDVQAVEDAQAAEDTAAGDDAGPTGPAAHEFEACEEVSSTDDPPAGLYTLTGGCVGYNPLSAAGVICADAVFLADPAPTWAFSGVMVAEEGLTARVSTTAGTGHVWFPDACVASLGGGTCEGLATFIRGLAEGAEVDCRAEAAFGGCACAIGAATFTVNAGTTQASPGEVTITFRNDDGAVETNTFTLRDDGDDVWTFKHADGLDLVTITRYDGAPTDCQAYCAFYIGACHTIEVVGQYDDFDACVTACADFPTTDDPPPVTTGDSVQCRLQHARLASDPDDETAASTHCAHAQETPAAGCVD